MALELRPNRGGFLRPFGCGWFIREYLLGNGPEGSRAIDPQQGAPQADINFEYKEALARATARERTERIISRMVVSGADVTEEQADRIYERELKRVSRKFTHMRYHSFLMYFGVLKRLGWVEVTTKPSLPLSRITIHRLRSGRIIVSQRRVLKLEIISGQIPCLRCTLRLAPAT